MNPLTKSKKIIKKTQEQGMVAHAFSPSTQETEAGRFLLALPASCLPVCCHASHHDDNVLNLWNCKPAQFNIFLYKISLGHGVSVFLCLCVAVSLDDASHSKWVSYSWPVSWMTRAAGWMGRSLWLENGASIVAKARLGLPTSAGPAHLVVLQAPYIYFTLGCYP